MSFQEPSPNNNVSIESSNSNINAFTSPNFFSEGIPVWVTMDSRNDSFGTFFRFVDNPIPRSCRLCEIKRANGSSKILPSILVHCIIDRTRRRIKYRRPLTLGTIIDAVSSKNWKQVVQLVGGAHDNEERFAVQWQDSHRCHSVLHLAMRFRAPLNVIQVLVDILPGSVWRPKRCGSACIGSTHPKGATPFHIGLRQQQNRNRRKNSKFLSEFNAFFRQRHLWTDDLLTKILQSSKLPRDVIRIIKEFLPQESRDCRDSKGKSCLELNL